MKVYYDNEIVDDRDKFVLHYNNGFTGSFKKLFDNKTELNQEVQWLVAQEFEYSGKKRFKGWKSFYVTLNDKLVKPKKES